MLYVELKKRVKSSQASGIHTTSHAATLDQNLASLSQKPLVEHSTGREKPLTREREYRWLLWFFQDKEAREHFFFHSFVKREDRRQLDLRPECNAYSRVESRERWPSQVLDL